MAQNQLGVVDSNFTNANRTQGNVTNLTTPLNYTSVSALRARLTALDAFTYSAANLDILSVNDMVYAVRSIDDRTTIADYQPAQVARTS
jgi:hypothetical protein